jgi:hypothetical protein
MVMIKSASLQAAAHEEEVLRLANELLACQSALHVRRRASSFAILYHNTATGIMILHLGAGGAVGHRL